MDFALTDGQRALRREVRAWLDEELGADWVGEDVDIVDTDAERARAFNRALAARGWMVPAWPERFGGRGWSQLDQLLLTEQLVYHRAPAGGRLFGVGMVGPTLQIYGTPEQQALHLPPIREGAVQWCQGFSEPGAGSDLASLQTRAERDGDDYVINGQKIWTSEGHLADWMILLARTDQEAPKHRGISYLLVDIKKTPGIQMLPLVNLMDTHAFNQVYFDSVRVPKENLVGEENKGWYVATTTLDFERSGINRVIWALRQYHELVEFVRERAATGAGWATNPAIRHRLADLRI